MLICFRDSLLKKLRGLQTRVFTEVFISFQLKKIYSTLTTVSGLTVEKEMFCRYFRVCNVVENNENC